MPRNTAALRKLYETAHAQGGFFTARQARDAGYEDSVHPYQVRSGNWVREVRGVYRLAQFPTPSRPDLMVWQLWSRNRQDKPQGVFSHATALTLHDLSDVMPAKLDMTVPPGFRRMAAIPDVLRLRHARLSERDIQTIDGVRVTTPLRTLIDVIAEAAIAPELQVQGVDQALRRGLIMRKQLDTARVGTRARQRIDRILKPLRDGSSTPVRNRRRVSNRDAQRQRTSRTDGDLHMPVAHLESTYENVYAECPHCGHRNVFNRASDLKTFEPIAGLDVACEKAGCRRPFRIVSDRINPAHESLLFDSADLLSRKQYMQCVLAVAQSYEVFFNHFLHVQLLWRPFAREDTHDVDELNEMSEALYDAVQPFTFEPMRSIFLDLVAHNVVFSALSESKAWIEALPDSPRKIRKPAKALVESVKDGALRDRLLALYDARIASLRNRVVHKDAFRPTREQAEQALLEAREVLHPLTNKLRLSGDAEWYINGADR